MWSVPLHRREQFEALLTEYQSQVDAFREREVVQQVEEVQKVVAQLEQLGHNLEAAKQEAMVGRGLTGGAKGPGASSLLFPSGHQQ